MAQDTPRFSEDQPTPAPVDAPPEVVAPLARFEGREPDAPAWFQAAIAQAPERGFVGPEGRRIELLTWGAVGKPGLLLVHGNSAHADWWSCIAPLLATEYRVAAMSLAGMGASDWRDSYSPADFAADADACVKAARLDEGPGQPVYIGHSFGGSQVFYVAATHPERLKAAVLIDVGFGPTPEDEARMAERQARASLGPRIYPDLTTALSRFRLMPPQPARNLYIVDYIARRSLKRTRTEDGGDGWTWRFDPAMWDKMDRAPMEAVTANGPPDLKVPIAHIIGEISAIAEREQTVEWRAPLPASTVRFAVPDSYHHVLIDQPLALVAALRALLATWPA